MWGIAAPGAQLALLLAIFLALMLVRALLLYQRDVVLAGFQVSFVAALRNRVLRALAGAPWEHVLALRHARVTGLLGEDVGRIAQSTTMLIQGGVSAAMLAVQLVLVLALAPLIASKVIAISLFGAARTLRRACTARDQGAALVRTYLPLLQETNGFMGRVKGSDSGGCDRPFRRGLRCAAGGVGAYHVTFVRGQSRVRAPFAVGSAAGAAVAIALGYAAGAAVAIALGYAPTVPVPVLTVLLVLFARMAGRSRRCRRRPARAHSACPARGDPRPHRRMHRGRAPVLANEPPAGAGGGALRDPSFRHGGVAASYTRRGRWRPARSSA